MSKTSLRIWVASGLIASVVLTTGAEFAAQCKSLGAASVALLAVLPRLIMSGTGALGAYLIWSGWPRRAGRGLHCRRCGYHQEDRGRIVGECPECAAPWRWIGRFRMGERRGHGWMIGAGLALLVLVTGWWMVRRAAPWILLSWLPTDVLLQQLEAFPEDELNDHWTELDTRRVPAARFEQLAQALIRKKARDGYLSRRGEETIFMWVSASPEPAAVGRQYYSQVISAVMEAPGSAETGEQVAIRTQGIFRGGTIVAQPGPRIVVLSALYLGDGTEPAQTWIWPVRAITDSQTRPMTHLLVPEEPGTLSVRQVFWLAIGGSDDVEVTMGANGPVLPPGMQIYNQFEVARTIEVMEPSKRTKPATKGAAPPR